MKKFSTKVLALLLTLCMLTGMMIMPTSAEESAQSDGVIEPDTSWYTGAENNVVYEIYDAADLLGFAKLANNGEDFAGVTIKLMADIDLNPGWTGKTVTNETSHDAYYQYEGGTATLASAPANVWPEVRSFSGTFDGQGHYISGIYAARSFGGDGYKAGFINEIYGGTLKNVIILNSVATATATSHSSANQIFAGLVANVEDSTIKTVYIDMDVWWVYNKNDYKGALAGLMGNINIACDSEAIDDLVYAGKLGILDNMNGNTGDFNMVKEKDGATEMFGILGKSESTAKTTIGDIAFIGNLYKGAYRRYGAFAHKDYGKHVTAKATLAANDKDSYEGADPSEFLTTAPMNLNWERVSAEGTYGSRGWVACDIKGTVLPRSQVLGTYHYLPGTVASMISKVSFSVDTSVENTKIAADTSWYSGKTPYYLYDAADLLGFAELAQTIDFANANIKLMADIDLNPGKNLKTTITGKVVADNDINGGKATLAARPDNVWPEIPEFAGVFDGQGHVIKGIYADREFTEDGYKGTFVNDLAGGTIKNIVFTNSVAVGYSDTSSRGQVLGGVIGTIGGGYLKSIYSDIDVWWDFGEDSKHGSCAGVIGAVTAICETDAVDEIVIAGYYGAMNSKTGDITKAAKSGKSAGTNIGSYMAGLLVKNKMNFPMAFGDIAMLVTRVRGTAFYDSDMFTNTVECNGIRSSAVFADNDSDCRDDAMLETACDYTIANGKDSVWRTKASYTYAKRNWKQVSTVDTIVPTSAYSGFANAGITYLPGSVVDMLTANTSNIYLQKSLDGTALRIVGVVQLTEAELDSFSKLGFDVAMTYAGYTYKKTITTTTVYTSIVANGATVNATEYGGTYFFAIEITGLDAADGDVVFDIDGIITEAGDTEAKTFGSASYTFN